MTTLNMYNKFIVTSLALGLVIDKSDKFKIGTSERQGLYLGL